VWCRLRESNGGGGCGGEVGVVEKIF